MEAKFACNLHCCSHNYVSLKKKNSKYMFPIKVHRKPCSFEKPKLTDS